MTECCLTQMATIWLLVVMAIDVRRQMCFVHKSFVTERTVVPELAQV